MNDILYVMMTPVSWIFLAIVAGCFLGKIKICGISLDLSAVLLTALGIGAVLSCFSGENAIDFFDRLRYAAKMYSALGTALFTAAVGISGGISVRHVPKTIVFSAGTAVLMVMAGGLCTNVIAAMDADVSHSALIGIFCGALTGTPGMAVASERYGVNAAEIAAGYGCAYPFGVIFVVLFVQFLMNGKNESIKTGKKLREKQEGKETRADCLILVGMSVICGTMLGKVPLPFTHTSFGTSGGILLFSLAVGFLRGKRGVVSDREQADIMLLRKFGLALFLAASGIPAGLTLRNMFSVKWLLYGAVVTVVSVLTGYMICRLFLKKNCGESACIIAGGMTSTPAFGVLTEKNRDLPATVYSAAYIAALLATVTMARFM